MFAEDITLSRPNASGSYVDGLWEDSARSTSTIRGSFQPIRGNELVNLPEAQRTRELVKIYTEAELRTEDTTAKTVADILIYNGIEYEVIQVSIWPSVTGIPHYKVFAARKDIQ